MSDFNFVSSGDPRQDSEIARSLHRSSLRMEEGLCPNGCGPIEETGPGEVECPACHFIGMRRTLFAEDL